MKILALDVASSTGWACYDTSKPESAIEHGSIKLEGKGAWEKTESLRHWLPDLIRSYKPEFVAIERPLPFVPQYKKTKKTLWGEEEGATTINAATTMQLNHLVGAVQAITLSFNLPYVHVAPRTWQAVIPKSIRGESKQRVKEFCDKLGITGGNMDSRDAAVIALWCRGHCQEKKWEELTC